MLEMKSCHVGNLQTQIRKGVSQLFEYRFTHKTMFRPDVDLALVLESPPDPTRNWLLQYLGSLSICPGWRSPHGDALDTSMSVPPSLRGVFRQIDG
jgi:hypothetical protein